MFNTNKTMPANICYKLKRIDLKKIYKKYKNIKNK